MPAPKISIVIPCYNQGHFIREAIASAERIPEKELFEIVIVNDGSTDAATIAEMQALEKEGYHVVSQPNKGLGAARNAGIRVSKGEYILPLDSDNRIRPEYIYEGIRILDSDPSVTVVHGDAEYFGGKTGRWETGPFNLQRQLLRNYIDACAVYRRSAWEKHGGYDEKMPVMGFEDWDFWLRIAFAGGRFFYVPQQLFDYRFADSSMLRAVDKEKYVKLYAYMNEKHKDFLDQEHLNEVVNYNLLAQKRSVAMHMLFASIFPGFYRYLLKRGRIRKKKLI